MSDRCMIGVDLGGTNVRAQALFENGEPAGPRFENASRAQNGTTAILDSVAQTIMQAAEGASVRPSGVGLAIPGFVDDAAGLVRWAPNFGEMVNGVFRYWENVPVSHPLVERTGFRLTMGNDANLAALGEYRYGAGENSAKCLVAITVGTGIGGGVVLGPQSVQGSSNGPLVLLGGNKGGAELGHIILQYGGLDCNTGSYGSFEAYCQRDAIVKRAQYKLKRGRESILNDLCEKDLGQITPRMITEGCDVGDAVALEVFAEVGEYLGVGVGSLINVFAPDVVAIGGQIGKAGKYLIEPAIRAAEKTAIPALFNDAKIVGCRQIDDAGLLGAAALAFLSFTD